MTRTAELGSLDSALARFCEADVRRRTAVEAVEVVTGQLIANLNVDAGKRLVVVPVVRAGLAMLPGALKALDHPEALFAVCRRDRPTGTVECDFAPVDFELTEATVVILDVVAARGVTLSTVCESIREAGGECDVHAVVCFAAPQALTLLATLSGGSPNLVVGRRMRGVDDAGFVIPPTHGDAGDKLFGALQSALGAHG